MWKVGAKGGDPLGYYLYLPATFIHQDLDSLNQTFQHLKPYLDADVGSDYFQKTDIVYPVENGRSVIKYTSGLALTQLPSFLVAMLVTAIGGGAMDGFSEPFIFGIYCTGFIFGLAGLFLLRLALLRWFSENVVSWSLISIALATNLFFFTTYHSVMAHSTLFFFHVLVLWQTIKIYESPSIRNAILLGLGLGFILLIRPSEVIIGLLPLLYGMQLDRAFWTNRWKFLKTNTHLILWVMAILFILCLPQLAYWYSMTGHLFFYSYGGEGFDFLNPRIIDGLLSYSNGWLAYTPVMILAIAGVFFYDMGKELRWPIYIIWPLHIYIIYSWWCWNYINGFGSRPMIEMYGLLAFPLANMIERLFASRWSTICLGLFLFICLGLNLFNTWQYDRGLLWSEMAKREFYFAIIGKSALSQNDLILYDTGEKQPNADNLVLQTRLYETHFEEYADALFALNPSQGKKTIFDADGSDLKKGDLIRVSLNLKKTNHGFELYNCSYLGVRSVNAKGRGLKTRRLRLDNKIGNEQNHFWGKWEGGIWDELNFYYKVPEIGPEDRFQVYLENYQGPEIHVDWLKIDKVHQE